MPFRCVNIFWSTDATVHIPEDEDEAKVWVKHLGVESQFRDMRGNRWLPNVWIDHLLPWVKKSRVCWLHFEPACIRLKYLKVDKDERIAVFERNPDVVLVIIIICIFFIAILYVLTFIYFILSSILFKSFQIYLSICCSFIYLLITLFI